MFYMEKILFKDISKKDIRKTYSMKGRIETVKQTGGPTLMILTDGTANFMFKAFVKPGVRAYPEANVGDCVVIEAQISDRKGDIEGEVRSLKKLDGEEAKKYNDKISALQEKKFEPTNTKFTIKSKW